MMLMSRSCSMSRSGSLMLPEAHHAAAPGGRGGACMPRLATRRRSVRVRAQQEPQQQPRPESKGGVVAGIRSSCERFLARYDPVTTGVGALLVTGYAVVAHEQSVGEALNIAACATVLGMVLQEVLFNDKEANENA